MTEHELFALIVDHEADRVEFTVSTTDTDKFAEAVCAFANDLLLTVLRELDALVDAQLTQFPAPDSTLRERTVESYPRIAVRELLMNAVMHRDYASTAPLRITWLEDRLEIQSPGGLYGEASRENFPRQTSYRNPVIAEALKALGYVNASSVNYDFAELLSRAEAPR